jgi:hypothetical protein
MRPKGTCEYSSQRQYLAHNAATSLGFMRTSPRSDFGLQNNSPLICAISGLAHVVRLCLASDRVRFIIMNESSKKSPKYENTLLRTFDSELIARLRLAPVVFRTGQKIEQPGKPIRYLYFLDSGMASMTTMFPGGTEVEVGMFGYESVIGVSALMGTVQSLNHVYTQVAGTGYRCSYANALKEFSRFGVFHDLCLRYVQAQLVQSSQSAGALPFINMSRGFRVGS